jgi:hypothetical protein
MLQKNGLQEFWFSGSGSAKNSSVIGLFFFREPALKGEEIIEEICKGTRDSTAEYDIPVWWRMETHPSWPPFPANTTAFFSSTGSANPWNVTGVSRPTTTQGAEKAVSGVIQSFVVIKIIVGFALRSLASSKAT